MNYTLSSTSASTSSTGAMASANPIGNKQLVSNQNYLYNGKFYQWDVANNKWIESGPHVYSYIDYLTGINYEWNQEDSEWQPSKSKSNEQTNKTVRPNDKEKDSKKEGGGWFDITDDRNTNVYVSGLPLDIEESDFETMMSKYGVISKNLETKKLKLKLYADENGGLKGDGICTYLMPESVKLCLQLLDGSVYKGHKISAEKAKFQPKTEFTVTNVKKKSKDKKIKEKKYLQKQRQK